MTLKQAMDNLAVAKADLDNNPNNKAIIETYNKAIDDYQNTRKQIILTKHKKALIKGLLLLTPLNTKELQLLKSVC